MGKCVIMFKRTIAALALAGSTTSAAASEQLENVGKLTCTVDPKSQASAATERTMNCRYQPLAGPSSSYTGSINRLSGTPLVDAQLVIVWTVLTRRQGVPASALAGNYLSSLTGAPSPSALKIGTLRRKSVEPIELRTLTPTAGGASQPTVVLELELRATRA